MFQKYDPPEKWILEPVGLTSLTRQPGNKAIFSMSTQGNLIVKKLNEVQRKLKDRESQKQQIQVIF